MQSRIITSCLQHQKHQQHVTIATNLWEEPLFKGLDEHLPPPFPQYPFNTKSRSVMWNSRGCSLENFFKTNFGLICCQLEDEVEKLLGDNRGLVQSDHALKLSRLMVRAETTEQRIMLLKILQVNTELWSVLGGKLSDAKIDICLHGHLKEGPVGYNMGRLPCRKGLATRKRDNSKIIWFSMVAFLCLCTRRQYWFFC